MKRRHVSGKKYAKKHHQVKKHHRAINSPRMMMRGGIRL